MATTIDQKVVEMRFDNRDFEKNTRQSMSTLEKLKAKLNFTGASKGLEEISNSAKKVDMNGLASGVELVGKKFSALEIMGVTALVNITNSAVNAGKALLKNLTVNQISSGWTKMNEKLSYVQTLVNSTGKSTKEINGYLEELMWFSDETSYSFTEMAGALAQMTSTGGKIEKLVPMITGIANSVAFAGKGAGEFSRAIFNLNQSYGSGALTLMDWKSLQGAGVNSKQLTEELIKAGKAVGTIGKGSKALIKDVKIGTFNDSLKKRWANTEVMEKAFGKFSELSQFVRKLEEEGGYKDKNGKWIAYEYTTASKAIEDFANKFDEIPRKAFTAAQSAKSFKEAMDATADAVSSKWMQIFEDIFGGYEEQKRIWTNFANFLYDNIVEPLNTIEEKIKTAFNFGETDVGKMWTKLEKHYQGLSKELQKIEKQSKQTSKSLSAYQKVVKKVWHGDYGNMAPRFKKLEKEGWDSGVVQDLVNKGVNHKLTLKDVEKAEKKYGITTKNTNELLKEKERLIAEINAGINNLSDDELDKLVKEKVLTQDEVEMYKMMKQGADKYGMSLDSLVKKMKKANAHDLIFGKAATYNEDVKNKKGKVIHKKGEVKKYAEDVEDENGRIIHNAGDVVYETEGVFQHLGSTLVSLFQTIKDAWNAIFGEWTAVDLYMLTDKINNFSKKIKELANNKKFVDALRGVFKGLFSVLKLITTIVGGAFKIVWSVISTVLRAVGLQAAGAAGGFGELISKVAMFITKIVKAITESEVFQVALQILGDIVKFIATKISNVVDKVKEWYNNNVKLADGIDKLKNKLKNLAPALTEWWKGLKEARKNGKAGEYLINSFKNAFKKLKDFLSKSGSKVLDWFSTAFANSKNPFGKMFAGMKDAKDAKKLGGHIISGLVEGITTYAPKVLDAIKWVANIIIETFKGLFKIHSPSKVMVENGENIMTGLFNGMKSGGDNIIEFIKMLFTKIIDFIKDIDLGTVFVSALGAGVVYGFVKVSKALTIFAEGLQSINGLIRSAQGVLAAFSTAINKIASAVSFKIITSGIKDIAIAIAILVASIFVLTRLESGKLWEAIGAVGALAVIIGVLAFAVNKFGGKKSAKKLATLALTFIALGIAMILMARAITKLSKIENVAWKPIVAFGVLLIAFVKTMQTLTSNTAKVTKMVGVLLTVALLFVIMTRVIKVLGKMDTGQLKQGLLALTAFTGVILALFLIVRFLYKGKTQLANMAALFGSIASLFYVMARVVKLLGKMDQTQLNQGLYAIAAFTGVILALMLMIRYLYRSKKDMEGLAKVLLSISACFLMMAISVQILGRMKPGDLLKGVVVIGVFAFIIANLISVLNKYGPKEVASIGLTLLGIAAVMGVMAMTAALFSIIEWTKLAKGLIGMSVVCYCLKGLIEAARGVADAKATMIGLAILIGALSLSLLVLSFIDWKKLIAPTIALGALLLAFSVVLKAVAAVKLSKKELTNIWIIYGLVVALAAVVAGLSFINAKNAMPNVIALSVLLITMVGALYILSKIGSINIKSLLVSLASLTGLLIILLLAVNVLKKMDGVQNAGKNTLILLGFLAGLSLILLALTGIGLLLTGGGVVGLLAGMAALFAMIGLIFLVIKAIDKINTIENAESNVKLMTHLMYSFIALLIPLAILGPTAAIGVAALYALVALLGPMLLFATAIGAITSYIPKLEEFMNKGMSVLIALASGLGEMIGAFVGGMLTKLTADLPQVGLNLSMFMINATPFIIGCKLITGQTLKAVGILAACIIALTATNVIDSIASFISGGDFSRLGTELSEFGKNVKPFVDAMKDIPSSLLSGIKSLSLGILALTAANVLEGIARFIGGGESSLSKFGEQLPPLGTSLAAFVTNLGTFSEQQVATVDCAGKAIKALAESAKALPKSGGWVQKILGEGSLADFADKMPGVAKGVKQFVAELGEFSDAQIKTAQCACEVIKAVADAADSVPKKDGLWQKIFGDDGLSKFADNMPKVAKGVNGFLSELIKGKITDEENQTVIEAGTKVISSLAELGKEEAIESLNDNIVKFGEKLPKFATQLSTFIKNMASVSKEDAVIASENVNLIVEAIKNMLNIIKETNADETPNIKTSFEDVAKAGAEGLYTDDIKAKVQEKAKNTIDGFVSGLTSSDMLEKLKSAGVTDAKKVLEGYSSVKGANINSPSKAAEKLGVYTSEGLYVGIMSYSDRLYHAGESVANNAKDGLSKAVAKISSMINSDMDVSPTIRPVLDISDVADGVGQINSMFNGQSLGLTANLNAISSSMAQKNQNGTTNDVISAIKDLSSSLGGRTGDTYNINGITYDDGSSISNAVETLIRAANIERRI